MSLYQGLPKIIANPKCIWHKKIFLEKLVFGCIFFDFVENLKQHRKSGYFATGWFPEFAWVFHPNEQTKAFKRPRQTKKGRTKKWGKFSWHYPSGVRPPLSLLNDTFFHFQNRLNRAEYTKNTCFCGRKNPNGRR